MGNWVTVEAIRQIKLSGRPPPLEKLGAVLLAAPDIDIDVFKSQMRSIGNPAKPFYIILSKDDKALRASNFIAGRQTRLGADENTAELAELGAVVVDSANHGKFAELAQLGPELSTVLAGGIGDGQPSPSATQGPGSAFGAVITSPFKLLGGSVKLIKSNGGHR